MRQGYGPDPSFLFSAGCAGTGIGRSQEFQKRIVKTELYLEFSRHSHNNRIRQILGHNRLTGDCQVVNKRNQYRLP